MPQNDANFGTGTLGAHTIVVEFNALPASRSSDLANTDAL